MVMLSLKPKRRRDFAGTGFGLVAPNILAKNLSLIIVDKMLTVETSKNLGAATGIPFSLQIISTVLAVVYVGPYTNNTHLISFLVCKNVIGVLANSAAELARDLD